MCEDRCMVRCGFVLHVGRKKKVDGSAICKPISASGADRLRLLTEGTTDSGTAAGTRQGQAAN